MLVRAVVDSDPGENHDALSNSAQLGENWRTPVGLFDIVDSYKSFVNGLEEVLVDSHFGAIQVRLLGLRGDEQEVALGLETLQNFGSLRRT